MATAVSVKLHIATQTAAMEGNLVELNDEQLV